MHPDPLPPDVDVAALRYQPRRTSAFSYSGARDRGHARSPKNLVVIIPPRDFPLDQGPLGNVLSTGPRHRLAQGMLMPLFPSLFGQLNAIAREYNFPSTVGLCLYLHISVNEHGVSMTPRISDESWQYLFGHFFEDRLPFGTQQLPIGGTIEFDIDFNKARWYDAWASGSFRELEPQAEASVDSHWRRESQPTNVDEQHAEDRWHASGFQTPVGNSRPTTHRHLPKKLSLVERLESRGALVSPRLQIPSHPSSPVRFLSPIPQSAAPRDSKSELEQRVNSWRETTELFPGVDVPAGVETMDEFASVHNSQQGVKADEYHWSVTSHGPQSPIMESPVTSSRPSSVHLDRRANGSVLLTPTTVTSWGPGDDDWYSDVSSVSRLPSPDLGERVIEDIMAPRPRGVWGNSFGWRSAMTWNEVYPFSTFQAKPPQDPNDLMPQYPDLVIYPTVKATEPSPQPISQYSTRHVSPAQLRRPGGLESHYPNICIYPALYPSFEIYPAYTVEEDISQPVSVALGRPNDFVLPYPSLVIYPVVYPHFDIYPSVVESVEMKGSSLLNISIYDASTLYPNLVIYAAVYPHFDLYPATLQVTEMQQQREDKLVDVSGWTAEYPNMTIYPNAPTQDTRNEGVSVVWGVSFGWLSAKTWLQVYPLNAANLTRQRVEDQDSLVAGALTGKQKVRRNSFGLKSATTWGAVQPTPSSGVRADVGPIPVRLEQQNDSFSSYPYLVIYPVVYPHFNIYPRTIVEAMESQMTGKDQCSVKPIPHYPELAIYPAMYPHLDVYPALQRVSVTTERGNEQPDFRCRRIEMWRAKTPAQVGLAELIANNHQWEAEEPLRIDVADYDWSQTSAGPPTSPLELSDTSPISGSVHIDRRIQGSVSLTPSTATTWGPQDDDRYSDILGIEQVPSPNLGQRVPDDDEKIESSYQPWHFVWPFVRSTNEAKTTPSTCEESSAALEYPHMVIYPPAYSQSELHPTLADVPALRSEHIETSINQNIYPHFDIYPAVYPHFNIYPTYTLRIGNLDSVQSKIGYEKVETRPHSGYPNIYDACYPYNLDCIYPSADVTEPAQLSVEDSRGYPQLVIYTPVYPHIILYPDVLIEIDQPSKEDQSLSIYSDGWKSDDVKLPSRYPILEPYPAVYPWSLESIYPAASVGERMEAFKPQYPYISIYSPVYPFVQPYLGLSGSPYVPGSLDEGVYESIKAFFASSEMIVAVKHHLASEAGLQSRHTASGSAEYPSFDLSPAPLSHTLRRAQAEHDGRVSRLPTLLPKMNTTPRRQRKTHMELHVSVFLQSEKLPLRETKTHVQLHAEVFRDGVVWTPSGYLQDLTSLTMKNAEDMKPQRRPPQDNSPFRPLRSRLPIRATPSADKAVFSSQQPTALPVRVRNSGTPPQSPPAVSATPIPRVPQSHTLIRSTSSRFSPVVKPVVHRRSSSGTLAALPYQDHKEHPKEPDSPSRPPSRWPPGVPPSSRAKTTGSLTRVPSQTKESSVLQRARAYEQAAGANFSGLKETPSRSPFASPMLRSMAPTSEVTETIQV